MEPKRDTEEAALPITLCSSSSQIPPGTRSHIPPASAAHSHPAGSGYARVRAPALSRKTGRTAPFPELQLAEPAKKSFKTPPSTANSASPFSPHHLLLFIPLQPLGFPFGNREHSSVREPHEPQQLCFLERFPLCFPVSLSRSPLPDPELTMWKIPRATVAVLMLRQQHLGGSGGLWGVIFGSL